MKKTVLLIFICLFFIPAVSFTQHKIAILGDSRSDGEENTDGINKKVLSKLCKMIKTYNPEAVFFTGDLTLGLEKSEENEDSLEAKNTIKEEDMFGNHWAKSGFIYNGDAFKKQLNTFSEILNESLGFKAQFFPLIGNHEAVGPDAITLFKSHFGITNVAPIDSMHLAYTVEMGNLLFVMLATDYFNREENALVEHKLSEQQINWLDSLLTVKSNDFTYKFVMGHEPAFSVRGIKKNKPVGLDRYPGSRDEFWNVLIKHGVNAYICAHEHLYNRSVHDGLLQVISGGAGAPLEKGTALAFYHFMILEVPQDDTKPKITVIDIDGKVRDEFNIE